MDMRFPKLREISIIPYGFLPLIFYYFTNSSSLWSRSLKALRRERDMLCRLMQKRFSEAERNRLYQKWGIGLGSKRRRFQLVNRLWSDAHDINHAAQSASIVGKLIRFREQGEAPKEMFGLSFVPAAPASRRSLGRKHNNDHWATLW